MTSPRVYYTALDGSEDTFAVPFPYLREAHVHFYLVGEDGELTELTGFEWASPSLIHFPGVTPTGDALLMRVTPAEPLARIRTGTLASSSLNLLFTQLAYLQEERAAEIEALVLTGGSGVPPPSSAITFKQQGLGSTTRSIQAKLRETLSVTDFGAVADGSYATGTGTDNAGAIDAAMAVAAALKKELVFPEGTYCRTGTMNGSFPGLRIRGEGQVIIRNTDGASPIFKRQFGPDTYEHDCAIINVIFWGSGAANQDGFLSEQANRSWTERVLVNNITGKAFIVNGEVYSTYANCGTPGNGFIRSVNPTHSLYMRDGPYIGWSANLTFINFFCGQGTVVGMDINKCQGTRFINGASEGMGRRSGMSPIAGAKGIITGTDTDKLVFEGTHGELNTGGDLFIKGTNHVIRSLSAASRKDDPPYEDVPSITIQSGAVGARIEGVSAYRINIEAGALGTMLFGYIDCHSIEDLSATTTRMGIIKELNRSSLARHSVQPGNVEDDSPRGWDWYQQERTLAAFLGGADGDGSMTQSSDSYWTRSGNRVDLHVAVTITAFSSPPSGILLVKVPSLPWACPEEVPVAIGRLSGFDFSRPALANTVSVVAHLAGDTRNIRFLALQADGTQTFLEGQDLTQANPTSINLLTSYRVAST